MCFSIPKKIKSVSSSQAITEDGVTVNLTSENIKKGEYVLLYGNTIVNKISKKEALETRKLIKSLENIT